MNVLIDRCEEAFAAVLAAVVGDVQVCTGKDPRDKEALPLVICAAEGDGAEEDPKGTGNFWIQMTVMVKTSPLAPGDDAAKKATSQALVSKVYNAIVVDNLPAQLSAAVEDFTVFPNAVIFQSPNSGRSDDDVWVDEFPMRVLCCPSRLAP